MFPSKMSKRAKKQNPVRSDKVNVGCIGGLIHMFDFHRSPKLLADMRQGIDRYSVGSELSNFKDLDDDTVEGKENGAEKVHSGRPSIKALIEEEMASSQSSKQHTSEEFGKLDEKRTFASSNVLKSLNPPEGSEFDINLATSLMDLYRHHNQFKETGSGKGSAPASDTIVNGDLIDPSNPDKDVDQKSSDIQKALDDIEKAVRNHRLLNKEHLISSDAATSNALQLLSSNKELFLKLLQDPDSPLLECLYNLYTSLGRPNLEPPECGEEAKLPDDTKSPKQMEVSSTEQPGIQRRQNLFLKEDKLLTKIPSKSNDSSRFSRIVILKPSPISSNTNLVTNSARSSSQPKGSLQAHKDGDKSPRLFSFREIKRRFRLAFGDNRKDNYAVEHPVGDSSTMSSSSKTSPDSDIVNNTVPGTGSFSYDEAKKHLAERLDGQEHGDNSRIVWKSEPLGRLMSFREYDLLSPRSRSVPEESDVLQQDAQSFPSQRTEQEKSTSTSIISDEQLASFKTRDINAPFQEGGSDIQPKEIVESSNQADNLPRATETQNSSENLTKENLNVIPGDVPEWVNSSLPIPPDSPESLMKEPEDLNSSTVYHLPATSVTTSPISTQSTPEKQKQPSPISVLDSSFSVEITSPTRRTTKYNEVFHPRNLFKELEIPSVSKFVRHRPTTSILEDKKTKLAFIREVLEASELCQEEENSEIWYIDDPLLSEEVGASYRYTDDAKLLFDCIDEVLEEIRNKYFGVSPWVSYRNNIVRPAPVGVRLIQEVSKRVDWHLNNQFLSTPDQIVMKDLDSGAWMDLSSERESIALESWDDILDDLLEELVFDLWL